MKSPLRWPGGKGHLAGAIVACMPPHEAFVETCCGGAAVFWAKPAAASVAEILNDADGELINFYCQLHRAGRRLAATVDAMPYSRALFNRTLRSSPRSPFGRAARFWYLNRVSFGARRCGATFGVNATRRALVIPASLLRDLDATVERLRGVSFECLDVQRVIELYDRPTSLFYVDPPFVGPSQGYACRFGEEDHARLASALRRAKGTWLLSYNDCRRVRAMYRGHHIRRLEVLYSIGRNSSTGGRSRARELLISNRPLPRVKRR